MKANMVLKTCPIEKKNSIGTSVAVDSLFIVAHIVCGGSVFSPYFVIEYFVSV